MSRRNRYLNALTGIRSGAIGGITGGVLLFELAMLETPFSVPLVIGGVVLAADGAWVLRFPTSRAVLPLFAGLLFVSWALLRDPFEPGRLYGGVLTLGLGWRLISCYRQLTTGELTEAAASAYSEDELKERRLEDLVADIRLSTMKGDRHLVQFTTVTLLKRLYWQGRLRRSSVVLVAEGSSPDDPTYEVVPKSAFEIVAKPRRLFSRKRTARFQIGEQDLHGTISEEALKRYQRWKGKEAPALMN